MNRLYKIRHRKVASSEFLQDGKFALGVATGLLFLPLAIYALMPRIRPELVDSLLTNSPEIVSLIVASVSAFVAVRALMEQRKAREASTDPVLIAHLGQRADAKIMITFCVSNVGAGAALNVRLHVEKPETDLSKRRLVSDVFERHRPFSVILQSQTVEFSLSTGPSLFSPDPLKPFLAKLEYEDLLGATYESEFLIDVRELEKMGAHDSPDVRIAKSLEQIARSKKG